MLQLILKFTGFLLAAFTALLVVLHAQPYDDHGLRDFLTTDVDCTMPCFLGIRPEVTLVDSAITLLENHPWVKAVHAPEQKVGFAITWDWSGKQPAWLSDHRGLLHLRGMVVQQILLTTTLSYGDLWLAFHAPEQMNYKPTFDPNRLIYTSVFDNGMFQTQSTVDCPLRPEYFWNAPQGIQIPARKTNFSAQANHASSPYLNKVMCP